MTEMCSLTLWLRVSLNSLKEKKCLSFMRFSSVMDVFVWIWCCEMDCCVSLLRLWLSGHDDQRAGVS